MKAFAKELGKAALVMGATMVTGLASADIYITVSNGIKERRRKRKIKKAAFYAEQAKKLVEEVGTTEEAEKVEEATKGTEK